MAVLLTYTSAPGLRSVVRPMLTEPTRTTGTANRAVTFDGLGWAGLWRTPSTRADERSACERSYRRSASGASEMTDGNEGPTLAAAREAARNRTSEVVSVLADETMTVVDPPE
jgi:hypothetical protein